MDIINEILNFIAPFLLGVIATYFGALINSRISQKKDDRNAAIEAYRRLMGLRTTIDQAVVTRFEAIIHSNYHERLVVLSHENEGSWNFREAARKMMLAESGVEKIMDAKQEISEACATLSLYFKTDSKVQRAIDDILDFGNFEIPVFAQDDPVTLNLAKDAQVKELQLKVESAYSRKINKLLRILKPQLF